jgi:hypothetical protein
MTPLTVEDIPGPKGLPLVGNMFAVPAERTIQTLMEIVREYGPMVRLRTRSATGSWLPRYMQDEVFKIIEERRRSGDVEDPSRPAQLHAHRRGQAQWTEVER